MKARKLVTLMAVITGYPAFHGTWALAPGYQYRYIYHLHYHRYDNYHH